MQQYNTKDNFTPVDSDMFTRINNDVNGNPRYVLHFLKMLTEKDKEVIPAGLDAISKRYELAVKRANKIGGRKYHTKSYGGGIVFQSYNLDSTCYEINKLLEQVTADQLK